MDSLDPYDRRQLTLVGCPLSCIITHAHTRMCVHKTLSHAHKHEWMLFIKKMMFIINMIIYTYIPKLHIKTNIDLMSSVIVHVRDDIKTYSHLS